MTTFEITTRGIKYTKFRDDPVFLATHEQFGSYTNNSTLPGILGCVDNGFIYDPELNQTWNSPEESSIFSFPVSYPTFEEFDGMVTDADLARILLSSAIFRAFLGMTYTGYELEAKSHCDGLYCYNVAREQWKVEARQWFEASLAQLQYGVLDIVRGLDNPGAERHRSGEPGKFPPNLRGVCHMGKIQERGVAQRKFLGAPWIAVSLRCSLTGQRHY